MKVYIKSVEHGLNDEQKFHVSKNEEFTDHREISVTKIDLMTADRPDFMGLLKDKAVKALSIDESSEAVYWSFK